MQAFDDTMEGDVHVTPAAIMCTPDCHRIVALGSALTAIEKEFKEILLRYAVMPTNLLGSNDACDTDHVDKC